MKILIVDDEPDMVVSLGRVLQEAGFDVASAANGEEAISQARDLQPDAVFMDIRMPRLNGIDACLQVLRDRPEAFMILMTGFSEALDEANQNIFAHTCAEHKVKLMLKPLDLDKVIQLLREQEKNR